MEKKIEVEIDGRIVRIMPHMLKDATKFGASTLKRQSRRVPDELLNIPAKSILPPEKTAPGLDVSDMKTNADPLTEVKMETTGASAEKKTPVKRNTKKK